MFSRIPNLWIRKFFCHKILLVFFSNKVELFYWDQKCCYKCLFSQKRHFAPPLKQNKTFFVKQNCGFVGLESVKVCHEQVRNCETEIVDSEFRIGSVDIWCQNRTEINNLIFL